MFRLSRRRVLLTGICFVLAGLPAAGGWSTGRAIRAAGSPGSSPAPTASAGPLSPLSPLSPLPAVSPSPSTKPRWAVPSFPPAPPPEPVVLPGGDEVPVLSRVPVTQPVAFLTIDDGYLKNPEGPELLATAGVPVTLFLTTDAIQDDVPYFARLRDSGAVIEAHTISHPHLRGRSAAFQRRQICGSADRLAKWYGRRPVLFRPPFGEKDHTTLRVAKECGMTAAVLWKETVHKGKVRYQEGHTVQRGDIILMHFRPAFVQDFQAALRAIHQAGLTPARLEDYIPDQRSRTRPDAGASSSASSRASSTSDRSGFRGSSPSGAAPPEARTGVTLSSPGAR